MDKQEWERQANWAIRQFARMSYGRSNCSWTMEYTRAWMYSAIDDLCKPSDERWWGPVVQRALREKIIRRDGFAPAKSSHGALKARYVGTRHA